MGPGAARNLGAKNSSAGWLLFLDADIRIDDSDFIKKLVDTSTTKGWHTATAKHKVWHGNFMAKVSASVWYSYFILLAHTKRPAAFGECILTSRNTFNRLGGFSEKVKFGEDFDYTARAVPWKFGIVSSTYYYIDPRRGNEEGIWLYIKGGVNEIYRQFHGGRVPKDIFKHKYGNHK
jgi:glycosyltransferase involved in cell wall biosynthesis